ncbi:MAG: hypothetical protein AB7P03_28370 [Kofleriaceae bacterium]
MTRSGIVDRLRSDPGLVLVVIAVVVAIAIYVPAIEYGLVSYEDPWLVRDNWIVQHPSWSSLHAIWFDTSKPTRFVLGAEYLPVRDLSIMLDVSLWGDWYGGFHLTSLVLYVAAIVVWFAALVGFGVDRRIAGVMALLWALHPSHVESVVWLSERKGLLSVLFAGVAALGYARFRAGRHGGYLAIAMIAAVLAIWSKAPSAFALAALGGLELLLPEHRRSWRRSALGLAAIGVVALAAFVPVLVIARTMGVVGVEDHAAAGKLATVLGLHGFYVRMAALAVRNSISYPIASEGPGGADIAIGALGLALMVAVLAVPARGKWQPPVALRAAALIWLFGWFPISRIALPLHAVLVADRYILFATLGIALAIAVGIRALPGRSGYALLTVIALAAALRSLDARSSWQSSRALWDRAVTENPGDGDAWSLYSETLADAGQPELAAAAVEEGRKHSSSPRLTLRAALLALGRGDRASGFSLMQQAAEGGEPKAMSNFALLLLDGNRIDEALAWATRGAERTPLYGPAHRAHGKAALAARQPNLALAAFTRAYELEATCVNRFNLALALLELARYPEAYGHLEACFDDPVLGPRARAILKR